MADPAPERATPGSELAGKRILVVDDDEDVRRLLRNALEACDIEVHDVESVDSALQALAAHDFDLIISDIGMLVRDGYCLVAALRARTDTANVPVVAHTSFCTANDHHDALYAGFDAHIGKTSNSQQILETLRKLLVNK